MNIHELKTEEPYFNQIYNDIKTFEVRKNDRDFQQGDILHLREYITKSVGSPFYSGYELLARITCILNDDRFVKKDYVILGISVLVRQPSSSNKRL